MTKRSLTGVIFGGLATGAGLMFMLDPNSGRRRRAYIRDKTVATWKHTTGAFRRTSKDLVNRASGVAASARSLVTRSKSVPSEILKARVRSKIGRVVSHPSAIEITAGGGIVTLKGPVLASEVSDLIKTAEGVRGVDRVVNLLEVHDTADVPALQGGRAA